MDGLSFAPLLWAGLAVGLLVGAGSAVLVYWWVTR